MPERIYKLQPNRTVQLRGFDSLGAAAALHAATANSFKVSGVFRDPADFAVLVLHDADNFYEHPRLKYLPDFNFDGLTLTFDVHYSGLMPLESPKYPTIDWPYLDVIQADGNTAQIRLSDPARCTQVGGTLTQAEGQFTFQGSGWKEFDRVTLWYLNLNFDYLVPKVECAYAFTGAGVGTVHSVTVNGVAYSITEVATDTNTSIATRLAAALAAAPEVAVTQTANQLDLRAQLDNGQSFVVSSTAGANYTLHGTGPVTAAANLAAQINGFGWVPYGVLLPLEATAAGATLTIRSQTAGRDGNMITVYAVAKNSRLATDAPSVKLAGGVSDAVWRVTLDFAALGIPQIRMMWLTFAPPLADSAAFADTEWQATFTNWTLTGPESVRMLPVAGPDSVRIEHNDSWCTYSGAWNEELGFFSDGYARVANVAGRSVTIRYACSTVHDLYLGTSLYSDRGRVSVTLDGGAATEFDAFKPNSNDPAIHTRRRLRTAVPAGKHTVVLTLLDNKPFYFDFLEAAVPGDVPDALPSRLDISPALDYSTDHTYKLPPARIHWMFDRLGFAGPMNEYLGVFWWNQRKRVNAVIPAVTVTFGGTFLPGDAVFLNIGGQAIGKSVFPNESNATIASHFAAYINATFVGVWAAATGNVLTVEARSPASAYSYSFSAWAEPVAGSTGSVSFSGSLSGGEAGTWEIDPAQLPALNRGAREWHADFYAECQARNREIVTACSMELTNPPAGFAAVFADGDPVVTSVGFGNLSSTHCSFVTPMLNYQKTVYRAIADLMQAAGVTPRLQMGEFLWWFFTNYSTQNSDGGMAFYDPETAQAALTALGRPLHLFRHPTDNPDVNAGADVAFLRNRLRDYVAALRNHVLSSHANAKFELLWPYDVNHPQPVGMFSLGGALNRAVNLPLEWEQKAGSGFDTMKMEALDFGAWSRNLDLSRTAIRFPLERGWPQDSVRYLVPVFRPASAWEREYAIARAEGVPTINLWAYDHVCLYNLSPLAPRPSTLSFATD